MFAAQSNRNLDAVLSGRAQLARQLARAGVGPQAIVNRVETNAVQVRLELVNGQVFGDELAPGLRSTTVVLKGPRRVDGAVLTLAVDASQAAAARRTLRRVLMGRELGRPRAEHRHDHGLDAAGLAAALGDGRARAGHRRR